MSTRFGFEHLRLPVIAAPMFLASGPDLVVACCQSGVVGTFPALNQRTTGGFDAWLTEIEERLESYRETSGREPAPYGVNLIVHKSNPRLAADLEVCVRHRVPLIITSLGAVSEVVGAVHDYGGLVFHDVTNIRHAHKAAEAGVDGLIAVAAGAGGHAGTLNPFALVGEIRQFFTKTVLLAGCISSGRDVAAAQAMGADFAYMGTRFLATKESMAVEEYKRMVTEANAADIVYTAGISSVPASFLRQSIVARGLDPDHLTPPGGVDLTHVTQPHRGAENSRAWRDIWSAGQGVGAIKDLPDVAQLVERLRREYSEAIASLHGRSAQYC